MTISKGPDEVPNVIGLNRSDAIKQIVDAGFQYDIRGDDESTEPRGHGHRPAAARWSAAAAGHDGHAVRVDLRAAAPAADRTPTDAADPTETPTAGTTPRLSLSDRPRSLRPARRG